MVCGSIFVINREGFSLIELLVVVSIIGILAVVGIVAYSGFTKSARINCAISSHNEIWKTLTLTSFLKI